MTVTEDVSVSYLEDAASGVMRREIRNFPAVTT